MGRIWLWGATKVWSTLSCKRQKCIIELKCIQLKISRITFYLSRLNTLFNFQHLFVPSELFLFDTSLYPKHQLIVHLFRPWERNFAQLPLLSTVPQIYDGKKKPEVLVDGWNVYFFDDLKALVSRFLFMYCSPVRHPHRVLTCRCGLPAAEPLAAARPERGDCGGAVARPAPLLHRGLWLQRARHLSPAARPPHHLQQAVDVEIYRYWRSACVTNPGRGAVIVIIWAHLFF